MRRYAAVAVIVTRDEEVLFIKRRENPLDPWSGDIAFPGGKKIDEDEDFLATAYREVEEEVGINLRRLELNPLLIGVFSPRSYPEYKVYAYNFWIDNKLPASPGEEVAEVYWINPRKLMEDKCNRFIRATKEYRIVECFTLDNLVIWGMTYRILKKFISTFFY